MKVCFPVEKNEGMNSMVYGHFGSAPAFVMVDTDEEGLTVVDNRDVDHVHGACNPIQAIGGQAIEAVVVGGIGAGAITGLNARASRFIGPPWAGRSGRTLSFSKRASSPCLRSSTRAAGTAPAAAATTKRTRGDYADL